MGDLAEVYYQILTLLRKAERCRDKFLFDTVEHRLAEADRAHDDVALKASGFTIKEL